MASMWGIHAFCRFCPENVGHVIVGDYFNPRWRRSFPQGLPGIFQRIGVDTVFTGIKNCGIHFIGIMCDLQKIKCHISNNLKRHQLELICCNRKLCVYSLFKTDVSKSHYLEQIKNLKHRRAVAKLRSGNHSLGIESGRHCVPKYLNVLEFVNTATLTILRTKIIS